VPKHHVITAQSPTIKCNLAGGVACIACEQMFIKLNTNGISIFIMHKMFWLENLKGTEKFENVGIDGKIILKRILGK
jgi:hypothetical protein